MVLIFSDIIIVTVKFRYKKGDYMDVQKELFLMQQAYATLFSLTNKVQIAGDKYIKYLTSRQLMVIVAIAHLDEEERTINNIAGKLGTTKQSVKQMLNIIEQKGYIKAIPSKKDKRAINIKVTEEGTETLIKCAELGTYFMAELFKNFSSSEIETLWKLLKKLYQFDGEEQNGFEAEGTLDLGRDLDELQENILKEFEKRRNLSKSHD